MPTIASESTVSLCWIQPGKEDLSTPCTDGRGVRGFSVKHPKLYALPYWWKGWGTAEWVARSSLYSKQWKEQPISAFLVWTTDHQQEAHMPAKGILQGIVVMQSRSQWWSPYWWAWQPHENSKAESIHNNRHQHTRKWIGGRLNTEGENSSAKDPCHSWHTPQKASGTEIFCCSLVVSPTESLIVSVGINCGVRTSPHWPSAVRPMAVGVIAAVIMIGDALRHTTDRWNICSCSNLRHEKDTTKKNIHYNKFPMAEDRNTSREESYPVGRGQPAADSASEVYLPIYNIWHAWIHI